MPSKLSWVGAAFFGAMIASLAVSSAEASVLYADNFDSDTPVVLNWAGDSLFESIPQPGNVAGQPSVDLVGSADNFGNLADGPGNSVDLDGTTASISYGPPDGELESTAMFGAGSYLLTFDLAGNLRNAPSETTVVGITGDPTQNVSYTPLSTQGYLQETMQFTLTDPGYLFFIDDGLSADQQGNLLDNIVLTSANGSLATPLPPTWTVMLIGLCGFFFVAYRRQKPNALVAA